MMEGMMYPLEQREYSWLLANISHPVNTTFFPSNSPSETLHYSWLQEALGTSDGKYKLGLQDVSIGLVALLALQECVNGHGSILPYIKRGAKKCKFDYCNIILVNILKTIIGLMLMTVMVPVMIPFLAIFWLTSQAVKLAYVIKYGSSVTKADGMDSVWGLESPESRPFITVCILVSGVPNLENIRRTIKTKVVDQRDDNGHYRFRKFQQVFSKKCGYYCWRDVGHFNIEDHVRLVHLNGYTDQDANNNHGLSVPRSEEADNLVKKMVSEEGGVALSGDRPPWEILLLARGDNRYNVVMRLHHAIGDGVSFVRLCVEALVDTPLPPPPVGPQPPSPLVKLVMMVWSLTMLPLGLLQVVANFDRNSLHGPTLSGRKVMTWSRDLPLPVLRQVKIATHSTVNDVLMSCLASALAQHFTTRKEVVRQVTAVMPLSFHDLRAPLSLTNNFSVAAVKLPVAPALSPRARLTATKRLMDGVKRDPTVLAVYWVVRAVSGVLPASVASLLLTGTGLTLGASNVPGPQQDISIWGDGVEELVFWVPNRAPVGLGVSFSSYRGQVKVGINVDEALITSRAEAQQLVDEVEAELYRLHTSLFPSIL